MAASAAALSSPSAHATKADANRANALLSTGPRTPEGKARASCNAIQFGLYASIDHLPAPERDIYERIASIVPYAVHFEPNAPNLALHAAAVELALLLYRVDRVRRLEFSCFTERLRALCAAENITEPTGLAERGVLEARIYREDAQGPRTLAKLHATERFFERQLRTANDVHTFLREQYESRPTPPAAPQSQREPAESTTSAPLASFSQIADRRPAPPPPTPRNAPCPCGSHLKFKHCCGKLAPPVLHMGARQPKS